MGKIIRMTESQLQGVIENAINEAKLAKLKVVKKQINKVNKTKAKPFGKLKENVNEAELNEIFGLSSKEQFTGASKEFIKNWVAKGVPQPSAEEMTELMTQAEVDKFQGKLKLSGPNIRGAKFIYAPASKLKWSSGFEGGGGKIGFGGA
mgnify:CR=1 FL=1